MKNKFRFCNCANKIFEDIYNKTVELFSWWHSSGYVDVWSCGYHDVDVEVYGLSIEQLESILKKYGHVNCIGKSFGILKLDVLANYDFALPRTEVKIGNSHQDFKVEVNKDLDLKTAALRRDLTVNALMYEIKTGKIYDFYGGIDDLNKRTLRMVDKKTFEEDPLRVLRVAAVCIKI